MLPSESTRNIQRYKGRHPLWGAARGYTTTKYKDLTEEFIDLTRKLVSYRSMIFWSEISHQVTTASEPTHPENQGQPEEKLGTTDKSCRWGH